MDHEPRSIHNLTQSETENEKRSFQPSAAERFESPREGVRFGPVYSVARVKAALECLQSSNKRATAGPLPAETPTAAEAA